MEAAFHAPTNKEILLREHYVRCFLRLRAQETFAAKKQRFLKKFRKKLKKLAQQTLRVRANGETFWSAINVSSTTFTRLLGPSYTGADSDVETLDSPFQFVLCNRYR